MRQIDRWHADYSRVPAVFMHRPPAGVGSVNSKQLARRTLNLSAWTLTSSFSLSPLNNTIDTEAILAGDGDSLRRWAKANDRRPPGPKWRPFTIKTNDLFFCYIQIDM